MRLCSNCGKEDKPWFEEAPCSCGVYKPHDDDPSPLKHSAECKCLGHEVVVYLVRMALSDLKHDAAGQLVLGSYLASRGWKLKRNGERHYRMKLLCRDCIELEESAQRRQREYKKACKAARGEDTGTYAQMLASQ